MDSNINSQPLLPSLDDHQINPKTTESKLQVRRSQSAPPVDAIPPAIVARNRPSKSIFNQIPHTVKQVVTLLTIYFGIGAFCFYLVRSQLDGIKTNGLVDAIYFCVVTMTTVGYGDLIPNDTLSKLLACAFVFTGMAIVALVLSKAADFLVEKQEGLVMRALSTGRKGGEERIPKEIGENKVTRKLVVTAIVLILLIVIGVVFLWYVENLSLIDSFYCVCATITTLGYGDRSFSTGRGRLFAVFWILISTICLAQLFMYIAEFHTEHKQQEIAKRVLNRRLTYKDLAVADLDDDGAVSAAEFAIYKLKEMGKIKEEDIAMVMKEFQELDVDNSGTLTAADIVLIKNV